MVIFRKLQSFYNGHECTSFTIHRKKKDGGCTFYHMQYLANQTKPTRHVKIWFNGSHSYTFLCVFIRSFRVFVRKALQVNAPVAIFFLTVDCRRRPPVVILPLNGP